MKNPVTYAKGAYKELQNGRILTTSRVIRRVAAPRERTVAWVFGYGPTALPPKNGENGLSEQILDTLREFGARATFGVFGSTAENYPDTPGRRGTKYATGRKYEHFAAFGLDDLAGASANPELIRRMAREGNELANYTYRNIPYAPERDRRLRAWFKSSEEAEQDFQRLHDLIYELTHNVMRFARPPRDAEFFADGNPVFSMYERLGYHRIAPGLESDGRETIGAAVRQRILLEEDPDALSGEIIERRDGFDTYGAPTDIESLHEELELLTEFGYRVVGAGELTERSAFEDVTRDMDCFNAVRALDTAGFCIGFRNNRFYPEREMTLAEIDAFIAPPGAVKSVRIEGGDVARARTIAAKTEVLYAHVRGQPDGVTRAEVAVWLAEVAGANGLLAV